MKTSLNIFLLFLILCASCGSRKANDNKETAVQADTVKKFTLPLIPAMLNTPELRADYLVRHYWDNMDFTDTTYINLPDVTEQAWVGLYRYPEDSAGHYCDSCHKANV